MSQHHASVVRDARAAHDELVRCAQEGRVFKLGPFLQTRRRTSSRSVEMAFRQLYAERSKVFFKRLQAELKIEKRTRPVTMAGHVEALRQRLVEVVAKGEPFKLGGVAALFASRGVRCQAAARVAFKRLTGQSPYPYYLECLKGRVTELRAARPSMPRAWLVVRTGATEWAIDKVLARLAAQTREQEAA